MISMDLINSNPDIVRGASFIVMFASFAILEILFPRRKLIVDKFKRWVANISLILINNILLRILLPGFLLLASYYAKKHGLGLFNYIKINYHLEVVISIMMLDLAIYFQHIMFHKSSILWRLHRVHHVDLDLDITTGLRFHPIEILISEVYKLVVVLSLGASVTSIILFTIILNTTSMFNHGNLRLPKFLDKLLRKIIVTPDMHLVHHSTLIQEHNSNYGFSLSIWDKIFRTYTINPSRGINDTSLGLTEHQEHSYSSNLSNMLMYPFEPASKRVKD